MDVVDRADEALRAIADPERAGPMAAYMRHQFAFLGIPGPQRRAALAAAWRDVPRLDEADLDGAVRSLWARDEREFAYAACDLLERELGTARKATRVGPEFLTTTVHHLITDKSWWDTVDSLRKVAVGPLVQAHPDLRQVMRQWVESPDRWLVRSAIIHQLGYRRATDADLLFAACARRATDREFFIAKAIGWALRQYTYIDPDAVRRFVDAHPELTPLARREALKHLG